MRIAAVIATLLLTAIPAGATQIVGFGQLGSTNVFTAVNNGNGTTSLDVLAGVSITNIISGATDPNALFNFEAESIGAAQLLAGSIITQQFEGTFKLTNQANTFTYLSGVFGGALMLGGSGGTGSLFSANTALLSPLTLATDLNVALTNPESFGLTLSNVNPALGISGGTINSFTASFVGTADAEVSPVPEPASLMLLGTGLVFAAGRARKQLTKLRR